MVLVSGYGAGLAHSQRVTRNHVTYRLSFRRKNVIPSAARNLITQFLGMPCEILHSAALRSE